MYTHGGGGGGGAHQRVSTTFLTRNKNLSQIFLALLNADWVRNSGSLDLESDALPTEPP